MKKSLKMIIFSVNTNLKGGILKMGKVKSLGYQIHTALSEINMQNQEKRTEIYNKENGTHFSSVGKREFKKMGQALTIFSLKGLPRTWQRKAKTLLSF